MDTVTRHVLRAAREHSLFDPGDRVIVAVSGGVDSVVLLDILATLPGHRLELVVCHLNHMLRGGDADDDQRFVGELAVKYGVPFETESVDVREASRLEGLSLEEAGRIVRYDFLGRMAGRHGASAIALAHHRDDQAETVLMRLLRGAGTTGLCAMAPKSGLRVRPLLSVPKVELESYARAGGLSFREDASNQSCDFLRNRMRHELIPLLETFNPAISERLAATADVLSADEELLDAVTNSAFARLATISDAGSVEFRATELRAHGRGLRFRIYRRAVRQAKGTLLRISYKHLQEIDELIHSDRPNLIFTPPGGGAVIRSYDAVRFEPGSCVRPPEWETTIFGPGEHSLSNGATARVTIVEPPRECGVNPVTRRWFDLDAVPFPWTVRGVRPGDRLVPLGMTGRKKVKDIFIDGKVPLLRRRLVPLFFSADQLFWVGGVKVAEAGRITDKTTRVVAVDILCEDMQ